MSDIIKRLNKRKKEKEKSENYSSVEQDPSQKSYDLSGVDFAGGPQARAKADSELQSQMNVGKTLTDANREIYTDPNSYGPDNSISSEYITIGLLSTIIILLVLYMIKNKFRNKNS